MKKTAGCLMICLFVLVGVLSGEEVSQKRFTVKGALAFDSKMTYKVAEAMVINFSNATYSGTYSEQDNFTFKSTFAFGAEYALWRKFPWIETSIGFNFPQKYSANKLNATMSMPYFGDLRGKADLEDDDFNFLLWSIYSRLRVFFRNVSSENVSPYAALKLSSNFVSMEGAIAPSGVSLKNPLGYGVSFGLIFFDNLDVELAYDAMHGLIEGVDGVLPEGSNNYDFSSMYVSLGYRI
ncbi:hypothetical protein NO1_0522 [Candidatus Termititenax aidoneus]|uniref:Outer membrane protein beta-barrel domain-containing protein n=1 Tax=Termititenax aidoneus TaxID=2218524 RepID=A0A388TA04_TERA1|nr:hypothetical protein NO1_0522 [Candidatus Termititenax aidoneus]